MIRHPRLFINDRLIGVAKRNIARHGWAASVLDDLRLGADRIATMELPALETEWWRQAREKPWQEIYPEINHHTGFVCRPAMCAAFQSALAFTLGAGEVYANLAKRVLDHFSGYTFEFRHPDVGLNYASWGIHAMYAYDMLYDLCSEAERERMDAFVDRMISAIARNDEWWIEVNPGGRFNNHYTWHKLMMAAYGLFYGREEWVVRAMDSDQGIRELMEHGFLDDGLWFESSLNYHFTTLHALIRIADMLRCSGHEIDLYTREFANGRTLEQAFSGMIQTLMPDLTVPQIGDTYGNTVYLPDEPACESAWIAYGKPEYAWLLSQKRTLLGVASLFREQEPGVTSPPPAVSRVLAEHGYVVLRQIEGMDYRHSGSWAAFVSYDLDSIHAHRDKFGLILHGMGKELAPDCNALASAQHAFSASIQAELNRTTLSHNTLMVDGRDHRPIDRKLSLIEFKPLPGMKTAIIADTEGLVYSGIHLQRTIAVTDDYVLDVFQASSDTEHAYDWIFHTHDDDGITRMSGQFTPTSLPESAPWKWLSNARSVHAGTTWQAEWHQEDVRFRLTMLGDPATEVVLCDYPSNDRLEPPLIPMLMARRRSRSTVFIAVYQAEHGELAEVSIVSATDRHGMLRVAVEIGGRTREHLIPGCETVVR